MLETGPSMTKEVSVALTPYLSLFRNFLRRHPAPFCK